MWKTVETKTEKIGVVEAKGERGEREREKEVKRERTKERKKEEKKETTIEVKKIVKEWEIQNKKEKAAKSKEEAKN